MSRRRVREDSGATAVEFALVMMPMLIIMFGIIQYAFYFWSMQGAADATRQAARLAAVGKPNDCASFKAETRAFLGSTSPSADVAVVTRTYFKAGVTPRQAVAPGAVQIGDSVEVAVTSKGYNFNFPFVPFIDEARVYNTAIARVDYIPDASVGSCA